MLALWSEDGSGVPALDSHDESDECEQRLPTAVVRNYVALMQSLHDRDLLGGSRYRVRA